MLTNDHGVFKAMVPPSPPQDVRGFPEEIFDRATAQDSPSLMNHLSGAKQTLGTETMKRSAGWIRGNRRHCSEFWSPSRLESVD